MLFGFEETIPLYSNWDVVLQTRVTTFFSKYSDADDDLIEIWKNKMSYNSKSNIDVSSCIYTEKKDKNIIKKSYPTTQIIELNF